MLRIHEPRVPCPRCDAHMHEGDWNTYLFCTVCGLTMPVTFDDDGRTGKKHVVNNSHHISIQESLLKEDK